MNKRLPFTIRGIGCAVPDRIMTNTDFEKIVDTSDEWIMARTGIRQRRICGDGENTLTLAVAASRKAIERAGISPADIDLIVVATSTPLVPIPATACFLQRELGCGHVPAFDIAAACSGFIYAFVSAASLMNCGPYKHALVVGAEVMSRVTDFTDRGTCILLGDGAGAAVIGPADGQLSGVYDCYLGANGSGAELVWVPAGGTLNPTTQETMNSRMHYLKMNGREVYKFAVSKMQEVILGAIKRVGITVQDLAMVVPHQSNARIVESATEKLGLPRSKVALNIEQYGNTSAASIPLALSEAMENGLVHQGDWVLLAGFGGGLTWGTVLLRL